MKQHYCFLKKFNNYFNRKIIKYYSLEEYAENLEDVDDYYIPTMSDGETPLPFDFNPNDNVMTEIIANEVPFEPDYFLLLNQDMSIASRWFILEQKRNRQGQWIYTLRRDVIADNLEDLEDSPIFVQKGMLPEDDPMIVNSEGMVLNQIKSGETLLKDNSKSAWVVCYLAKSLASADVNVTIKPEEAITDYVTLSQIANEMGITESLLASLINVDSSTNNRFNLTNSLSVDYVTNSGGSGGQLITSTQERFGITSNFETTYGGSYGAGGSLYPLFFTGASLTLNKLADEIRANSSDFVADMPSLLSRTYYLQTDIVQSVLRKYDGSIIYYLGKYYIFRYVIYGHQNNSKEFTCNDYNSWRTACQQVASDLSNVTYFPTGRATLRLSEQIVGINLEENSNIGEQVTAKISSSRRTCENQEFDIVFIPASDIKIKTGAGQYLNIDGRLAQKFASALAIQEGTNIYDVQLLPYCPRKDIINSNGDVDITGLTIDVDYNAMTSTDEEGTTSYHGYIFYASSASFQAQLDYQLEMEESAKIESQTDFYRIVSPNYQGSFEFNLAKNGGSVGYFTAYCTYRPYTPFIKVTPELKWLYGGDYNDDRGLICGGDFSLPRSSSAWQQYQLENKNYQNIFNRDIQHLDFMNSIAMRNQYVSGGVGILGDTVKGASAGYYVGGGNSGSALGGAIGAVVGGIAGMSLSTAGYAIDVDTMARTHRENKQLAIDKFNYQLGNIQALPYTLTKVGSFDISSKIFPVLVHYTCTEQEKQALKNKIKYESMTVMRIGSIREFRNFNGELNYFKGELIRNEIIADDPHTFNAIYEELLKGVYI